MDAPYCRQRPQLTLACGPHIRLFLLFLFLFTPAVTARVLVRMELSPNPVQVGQPFQVRIQRIEDLTPRQILLQAPPVNFPDLPGLDLLTSEFSQNISDFKQSRRIVQNYTYTLVAHQAGDIQIPPISVGEDQGRPVFTEPLQLRVHALRLSHSVWLPFLLLLALTLIIAGLWLRWQRRSPPRATSSSSAPMFASSSEMAMDVQGLRQELRTLLAHHLSEPTGGFTLTEMFAMLAQQGLPPDLQTELHALIHELERLRFQGKPPESQTLKKLAQQIKTLKKHQHFQG